MIISFLISSIHTWFRSLVPSSLPYLPLLYPCLLRLYFPLASLYSPCVTLKSHCLFSCYLPLSAPAFVYLGLSKSVSVCLSLHLPICPYFCQSAPFLCASVSSSLSLSVWPCLCLFAVSAYPSLLLCEENVPVEGEGGSGGAGCAALSWPGHLKVLHDCCLTLSHPCTSCLTTLPHSCTYLLPHPAPLLTTNFS